MNEQNNIRYVFLGLFGFIGLVFLLKLLQLQIFDDTYKHYASTQAIRRMVQYPPRGSIFDRKGSLLVNNEVSYDLMVIPKQLENLDTLELCRLVDMDPDEFRSKLQTIMTMVDQRRLAAKQPTPLLKQLSKETVAELEEKMYKFRGLFLQPRVLRKYPKPIAANILGYIGEVDDKIMAQNPYYKSGDYIGISGIEKSYEDVLRGVKGVKNVFVDVHNNLKGSYMDGLYDSTAVPGENLVCTIDADLQEYGQQLMNNKKGAVVAIEPATGEILTLVSSPSYDPNLLVGRGIRKNYPGLVLDSLRPLYNRAIQALYPPGSTFKPITALVALDEGVINASFGYPCGGAYGGCGRPIKCTHAGGGHAANLRLAMANSCNAYFSHLYRLCVDAAKWGGVKKGLEKWHEYMSAFGLGHPIGIDIPNEKGGTMPDSAYYNRRYKGSWNSCTSVFLGMGQGELQMTPLQMANAMCLIANKGFYYTPHLVKAVGGDTNHAMLKKYREKHQVTHISDTSVNAVIRGMQDVVERGTGRVAQLPGIEVCGKTGTVENYAIIRGTRVKLQNHSMFVCFAPRENPKIAIAVCVENSGYGATWAGPIASLIMEKYLTGTVKRPELEKRMMDGNLLKLVVIKDDKR
jgi:penicillin-binding protein 2